MKNKKIIARILALCASLLLVVALALPCFAEETEQTQYVLVEKTFSTYDELFQFLLDNFNVVSHIVSPGNGILIMFEPTAVLSIGGYDALTFSSLSILGIGNTSDNASVSQLGLTFSSDMVVLTQIGTSAGQNTVISNETFEGEDLDGFVSVGTVYYYQEAELTPTPIDPDAPTRTGLYGNLYYIIRDAIFGENALLDASQEFTLTQIATVMTYAVLLLPFIVVAIIFFKLVRL